MINIKFSTKTFFVYIAFTAVVVLSAWLYISTNRGALTQGKNANAVEVPDAIIENAEITRFDANGNIKDKLISPKMVHYTKEDTTFLTAPKFVIYSDSGAPWDIKSLQGKAKNGANIIYLWDKVKITRTASEKNKAFAMDTEYLEVFPQEKRIATDEPVTIIQPDANIQSKGLRASMETGEVELLSAVEGQYVPN